MKQFRLYFRSILILFAILSALQAKSQTADEMLDDISSTKVSLLTCGPGSEAYSLFGHTAIRICQPKTDMDIVVNYGMFSFSQPYFIARFVLGLTDYQMGIVSYIDFENEYRYEERWVLEQELNLNPQEKLAILKAINENYKPENRTYRYNYFYNNCTTKARDIIISNIEGSVDYNGKDDYPSFRDLCHSKTSSHHWSQFGNDLLLGIKADTKTNISEQQFLPEHLSSDFDRAKIINKDGTTRKLVENKHYIISKSSVRHTETEYIPTPLVIFTIICMIIIGLTITEYTKRKLWWQIDAILMTFTGLAGMILFIMIFSKHPTVSINLQILILNPLALIMAIPTALSERKQRLTSWHKIYTCCLTIGIIGGLFQHYAEGITLLALSLLIREIVVRININRNKPIHN